MVRCNTEFAACVEIASPPMQDDKPALSLSELCICNALDGVLYQAGSCSSESTAEVGYLVPVHAPSSDMVMLVLGDVELGWVV